MVLRIFFSLWFALLVVWNLWNASMIRRSAVHGEPTYGTAVALCVVSALAAVLCAVLFVFIALGIW